MSRAAGGREVKHVRDPPFGDCPVRLIFVFAFRALTGETEGKQKPAPAPEPEQPTLEIIKHDVATPEEAIDLVSPDDGNSSDDDNAPLGKLLTGQAGIKSAKKAAVKRTTEVSTESPAHRPTKHKNVSGQAAAEQLASTEQHSTAESGQVSPESATKLAAEPATPVKEASQAAVEKTAPSAMQSDPAADLSAERAVPPTDQVTTKPAECADESTQPAVTDVPAKEDAANDHSLAAKVADADAAKLHPAQAADEHAQQAADKESVPVTTAEAGQVITTDANKELSHGTKLLAVSGQAAAEHTGPVTTEHAADKESMPVTTSEAGQVITTDANKELLLAVSGQAAAEQSAPVTTEHNGILARARERAALTEQIAARRAAAKLAAEAKAAEEAKAAAEAEAKAKAAAEAEAKAKAAAEAAEAKAKEEEAEAKAAVEAKAKAAEEAKAKAAAQAAKVDELNATILHLESQRDDAALATQKRERDLADSKRLLHELSGSLESARENSRIKAAAAASSRKKHAENIEEHAAAAKAARALSDEFDIHFPNFDAIFLSVTIDDRKAELDAAAGEKAELDAAAGEEAKLLKEEIAILEATLDDGNALLSMLTSKKADARVKLERVAAALASEEQDKAAETQARELEQLLAHEHTSLQALVDKAGTDLEAALAAEAALTSKLNDARLDLEAKVAELNAAPQSSESSAPRVVPLAVSTGSPAQHTPTTPMFTVHEEDVAIYEVEEPAPLPQGPSVSYASPLLNAIIMHDNKDVIAAFCQQVRYMNPTREELADALHELLGPDVESAFHQALDNTVGTGRRTAQGGRSRVLFCHGVNDRYRIDETLVVRVAKKHMQLDEARAMKEHVSAVFDVLGQSADFLPLVMPAKTEGKFVFVIFSRDSGPNAFDAVDAEQLPEFILHVRALLAKCKRTNLVLSDLTFKNICWLFFKLTNIDLDESAFSRALGAEQSFLAAFSMLFTSKATLFDDVLETLLMSEISQRLRAPAQPLDPTGSTANGPLAAPLANAIFENFRLALTDAVNDHTLRKFIQRSVFFLFTHMSNFINDSGYPFSRSVFFLFCFTRTITKRKPVLPRCIKDVGEVIGHNLKRIHTDLDPRSKFWSSGKTASARRTAFALAYILFLSHLAFALMKSAATSCAKYEKLDLADQKRWFRDDTLSLAALDKQGGISLHKFSKLSAGTDPFSVFYEALTGEEVVRNQRSAVSL